MNAINVKVVFRLTRTDGPQEASKQIGDWIWEQLNNDLVDIDTYVTVKIGPDTE